MKKNYILLLGACACWVCVALASCTTGEHGVSVMFGGSSQALLFNGTRAVSEDEVEFEFSRVVTVKQLSFEPDLTVASVENGSVVRVKMEEGIAPGILLTADLLAEDEKNNTINVLVSFRSRNNRMPGLIINEMCTEYSKPKTEFIEFKMKSSGNLGAMRVVIMGNSAASKETIYEFKPVEVRKDEYVMLHLRTVEENCKDELGARLDESGGTNAMPTARDFWIEGNTKRIHKEASIIYVMDQDDRILSAVMISNQSGDWWGKDYLAEAAETLFANDAWKSSDGQIPGPANAVNSTGTTNTRTICRDETKANTGTKSDWYITATSSATPGKANNPTRYVPK